MDGHESTAREPIGVRFSAAELAEIDKAAKAAATGRTTLIRDLVMRAVRRKAKASRKSSGGSGR